MKKPKKIVFYDVVSGSLTISCRSLKEARTALKRSEINFPGWMPYRIIKRTEEEVK